MTVNELIRKTVCTEQINKNVMINGRDVVITESNKNLKVKDFRIVVKQSEIKIHIEV